MPIQKCSSNTSINMQTVDLEYHINIPKKKNVDFKEPVIVLFGWGGCSDKHLTKYSEIYEEQGCSTFRCIVPPIILFPGKCYAEKLQNVAERIISTLQNQKFEQHPLYFHSFSNGGCTVYNSVSQIMQKNPSLKFQIKGCIYDSAPAKIYAPNLIQAVVNAVKGSTVTKYTYAVLVLSYMFTVAGFYWVFSLAHCERPSTRRFELFETLAFEPNICPQLFLFSKIDDVCSFESIQEFINIRKNHGVDVRSVLWEDSEHVKHLIKYRTEYIATVTEFISSDLCPSSTVEENEELHS